MLIMPVITRCGNIDV